MRNYMCNGFGGGIGDVFGLGFILTILFWALIIWGIVSLIKYFGKNRYEREDQRDRHDRPYEKFGMNHKDRQQQRPGYGTDRTDAALDILRERYARGEINREEYEARKQDLM